LIKNKDLKRKIIDLSYNHKLSHIGSCLTAVDIIKDIYDKKKQDEKFILSNGHAGIALYVVLENYWKENGRNIDAQYMLETQGIHPDKTQANEYIDCSTGSLGNGIGIAVGMALADRPKNVWCMISDGELGEGSVHEALRVADEQKLTNLNVYVNWNGWAGYRNTDKYYCPISSYVNIYETRTDVNYLPFLEGLEGHYRVLSEDDYKIAMEILK